MFSVKENIQTVARTNVAVRARNVALLLVCNLKTIVNELRIHSHANKT